jgi:hypothetical protein
MFGVFKFTGLCSCSGGRPMLRMCVLETLGVCVCALMLYILHIWCIEVCIYVGGVTGRRCVCIFPRVCGWWKRCVCVCGRIGASHYLGHGYITHLLASHRMQGGASAGRLCVYIYLCMCILFGHAI